MSSAANSGVASGLVRSNKARVKGTDPAVAAEAVNQFSANLLAALETASPTDNLVCSPLSIATALAMTLAGAEGKTRDQMASVLGFDPASKYGNGSSVDDFVAAYQPSMNALLAALATRNRTEDNAANGGDGTSQVQLDIANALWGQAGMKWNDQFLATLAEQYGAGVETVDYATDAEGARVAINKWVEQATKDRIPELLASGTLDDLTRLVLVNAVYLKANWANAFDEQGTTDEKFTTAAGSEVTARMMHLNSELAYARGDGWKAVELPYVFGDLSMVAVVTMEKARGLPAFSDVTEQLSKTTVDLSFPRFDFETKTSLNSVLSGLGMPDAFTDSADFSGMTSDEALHISDVVHQANITTDENGTEAAAATAVVMATRAAPIPRDPVEIVFDRPFTFWLRDVATGAVVFAGRVTDPTK